MHKCEFGNLRIALKTCSPDIDQYSVSRCYNHHASVTACGVKYTSIEFHNSRLSYIQASWCGDYESEIDLNQMHMWCESV